MGRKGTEKGRERLKWARTGWKRKGKESKGWMRREGKGTDRKGREGKGWRGTDRAEQDGMR